MSTEHLQRMLETAQEQQRIKDLTSVPVELAAPYVVVELWPGQWGVAGPDGQALRLTFSQAHAERAAQDYASDLNAAWRAGLAAASDPRIPAIWRKPQHACTDETCGCHGPEDCA